MPEKAASIVASKLWLNILFHFVCKREEKVLFKIAIIYVCGLSLL